MVVKEVTAVCGEISGDQLGITLPHEHLHMQFDICSVRIPNWVPLWPKEDRDFFQMRNLGLLRQYPYSVPYNLKLDDVDSKSIMLDEIEYFKAVGGQTIVENTIHGISRNIKLLKKLSLESGVNIISGTGFYVAGSHDSARLNASMEEMHDLMLGELVNGCEDGIKCGIIGEIGCSYPMHNFEKKVVQAVALLQESTGKPITFHPGRHEVSPFEIMRVFTEAGGKAKDVVMCHLDRTVFKNELLLEFAQQKTFTQFDLFGTECSYYQLQEEVDFLSDAQRIQKLKLLVDNGHLSQIMMSHDIHTKHRLANFGGHGFAHILQNVIPKMKMRGFCQQDIDTILIKNPRRWLCSE